MFFFKKISGPEYFMLGNKVVMDLGFSFVV
jgi:hypothetical protein